MKRFPLLMISLLLSTSLFAVTNPTELNLKIYQISVALNVDCSDPQLIFQSTAGVTKDLIADPTLGSGTLADGTYNCVMITMDDVISYKPLANDGVNCVAGTTYAIDLCRTPETTDLLTGTTFTTPTCAGTDQSTTAGGLANKVTLYLRSGVSGLLSSWMKTNANDGIPLTAPFVVNGTETGIFYIDATNQIQDNGSQCEMDAPVFGFR